MARISQLKILEGIPFTADDKIVLTFNSLAEQENYFEDFAIETFTNLSFVKGFLGKQIKVNAEIESLYYANYIMFNNSAYGDKWFYAYITGFEYVSDGCTIINFELDYFQTYMGEIVFDNCFIERQMQNDNDIFSSGGRPTWLHSVEELPFALQDTIHIINKDEVFFDEWEVAIIYKPNLVIEDIKGAFDWIGAILSGTTDIVHYRPLINRGVYLSNKYYSGASIVFVPVNGDAINEQITTFVMAGYNILDIIMVPKVITNYFYATVDFTAENLLYTQPEYSGFKLKAKCFCYPFCYIEVTNCQGSSYKYKFEDFMNRICSFKISMATLPNFAGIIYPYGYYETGTTDGYELGLTIGEAPKCIWNENAMARYFNSDMMMDVVNAAASMAAGMPVKPDLVVNTYSAVMSGDKQKNNIGKQPTLNLFLDKIGWKIKAVMTANILDVNFFFYQKGYQTNQIGQPNILTNDRFNYVKTRNAVVSGDIPIECKKKVEEMLDGGITFWHDLDNKYYYITDDNDWNGKRLNNGRIF